MKHQEIFDKAYHSLIDYCAGKPDICTLNRFYSEKMILQESDHIRYFDLFGNIRRRAEELGEHIFVRGAADSFFIAYLLEATKSNVDPNLPFEMDLHSVFVENIQLGVSRRFFKEAREMIYDYMADKAIVTLKEDGDVSLTWICFLEKDENEDAVTSLKDNAPLFEHTPHITLAPTPTLDKYREIEIVTGVKMDDTCSGDMEDVFSALADGELDGIPNINTKTIKELFQAFKPQSYDDMLKLIGCALGSCIGHNQSEKPLTACDLPLSNVPVFCEDMYDMICEKLHDSGSYEIGLAYEVTQNTRRGVYARNGLDEFTRQALLSLGFNTEFCSYIEKVTYMFPKAHAESYLDDAIAMMWYKLHYPDEYSRIFMNRSEEI